MSAEQRLGERENLQRSCARLCVYTKTPSPSTILSTQPTKTRHAWTCLVARLPSRNQASLQDCALSDFALPQPLLSSSNPSPRWQKVYSTPLVVPISVPSLVSCPKSRRERAKGKSQHGERGRGGSADSRRGPLTGRDEPWPCWLCVCQRIWHMRRCDIDAGRSNKARALSLSHLSPASAAEDIKNE